MEKMRKVGIFLGILTLFPIWRFLFRKEMNYTENKSDENLLEFSEIEWIETCDPNQYSECGKVEDEED